MGKYLDLRYAGRLAMAFMLFFTALGHFLYSEGMAAMLPESWPAKHSIVWGSGILEIVFAIGLLLPSYHRLAGMVILVFFVLILPINIRTALLHISYETGQPNGPGPNYLWFRIPLQMFFLLWVYLSAVKQ